MQNTEHTDYIESPRLIIRHWREDDAAALYSQASDCRVSEMALWPTHTSIEMSLGVIRDIFIPNPHSYAIVLKETMSAIGAIGLVPPGEEHFKTGPEEREIGYWIGYGYWNRGITTEALMALVTYCKDTTRLNSLLITTNQSNTASQRVAEKCGFVHIADYDLDGIPSRAYRLNLTVKQP